MPRKFHEQNQLKKLRKRKRNTVLLKDDLSRELTRLQVLTADGLDRKKFVKLHKLAMQNVTKKKPCWEGYMKVGMKTKNGKVVNNCVPE